MPSYIHHVQWSVASVADTAAKLRREYGMRLVAARSLPDSGEREVVLQRVSAKGRPREAMRELVHDAGRRSWPEEAFVNCEACKWWLERRDNRTAPHAAAAHLGARVGNRTRVGKAAHPVLRAKSKVVPTIGAP